MVLHVAQFSFVGSKVAEAVVAVVSDSVPVLVSSSVVNSSIARYTLLRKTS